MMSTNLTDTNGLESGRVKITSKLQKVMRVENREVDDEELEKKRGNITSFFYLPKGDWRDGARCEI